MNSNKKALIELSQLAWQEISQRRDIATGWKIEPPIMVPTERSKIESRFTDNFPVLRHLKRALSLAAEYELAEIAVRFSSVMSALRWSQNPNYNKDNCTTSFLNGYAYAAFSGPDAPILCSVPRGGLMIMGPGVTYPDHHHQPKEVYLVMTPGAQWRLDKGEWFDVSPGDLIYHNSWQMHSMRTTDEPLLAFAGWVETGNRLEIDWAGDFGSPNSNESSPEAEQETGSDF